MLRYNPVSGAWLLYTRTPALEQAAREIGLDKSIPATARAGHAVYFTHDEYAALPFFGVADDDARDRLFVRHLEYENSRATNGVRPQTCPADRAFMPLQDAAIVYALSRPHCVVGDEVGIGKTITAIGIANEMQAERVLVVCPASVRLQWEREVRDWSTLRALKTHAILTAQKGINPYANFTFVSYDLLRNDAVFRGLMAQRFDLLVPDEIHYAKEVSAKRSVRLFGDLSGGRPGLADRAGKIVGLTGTFLPNRPRECYMAARALCWEAIDWLSEDAFRFRYNPSMRGVSAQGKTYVREERGRLPELRARLRCNFLVRRTKRDPEVQRQLAVTLPKYELTYLEPTGAIKRALKAESLLKIDPEKLEGIDAESWGHIATVRREMGVAKAPRVVEHAQTLLNSGLDKVAIFYHHREVGAYLAEKLTGGVMVRGGLTALQKQRIVDRFVADPRERVFLGQMQACGVGIDGLQKVCRWVLLPEPSWTPGDNEQVIGRVGARKGQTRDVWAQLLVVEGSLDDRILGASLRKLRITHSALDGGD